MMESEICSVKCSSSSSARPAAKECSGDCERPSARYSAAGRRPRLPSTASLPFPLPQPGALKSKSPLLIHRSTKSVGGKG